MAEQKTDIALRRLQESWTRAIKEYDAAKAEIARSGPESDEVLRLKKALVQCDRLFLEIYSNAAKVGWPVVERWGKQGLDVVKEALGEPIP